MRLNSLRIFAVAALVSGAVMTGIGTPSASADTIGDTARTLLAKNKGVVVQFNVVVKIGGGAVGEEQNAEQEAKGVVIDPSGLIVTTNFAIDPTSVFASMGGGDAMSKITSKVVSIRILTPEGEEIPARVVLRDTDRNLAFLRPITPPTTPLPYVDLKSGGKAQVGDVIFVYGRMGKSGNRGAEVNYSRVTGMVERPRLQYVIQPLPGSSDFGAMAFNEQGLPLGLLSFRVAPGKRGGFGGSGSDTLMVVVPTEDIAEIGAQAPQVKDVKEEVVTPAKPAAAPKAPGKAAAPSKK
ncbi:MAG: serine protease [Armatimonadota bacterium]